MLTDPEEIRIASAAKQKNVRDPARSRQHFFNIITDFFAGVRLSGSYVDLGPGQFDFGEIAREQGGHTVGIDFDPAVLELGQYKGFDTVEGNLRKLADLSIPQRFDGVFNKFALNAFWPDSKDEHGRLIEAVIALGAPNAWFWIAPWNGVPKDRGLSATSVADVLDEQRRLFLASGFHVAELSEAQARRYGVHGAVANNLVFIKGLQWRPA